MKSDPAGKVVKSTIRIPASLTEAEELIGEISRVDFKLRSAQAVLNLQIEGLRAEHAGNIKQLEEVLSDHRAALETFAAINRDHIFEEGKKSLEMSRGTIGFRLGKISLVLLSRQKWEFVLERLRGKYKKFIRTKEEVDKAAILREAAPGVGSISKSDLSELGLKLEQEETFFIELKEL